MRIRIRFTKLPSAAYSRRLYSQEPNRLETRQVLVDGFKQDSLVVAVASDHPTVLITQVLDETGRGFRKTTQYTFYPSAEAVAADAPSLDIEGIEAVNETKPDVVTVEVTPESGGSVGSSVNTSPAANASDAVESMEEIEVRVASGVSTTPEDSLEVAVIERPKSNEPVKVDVPIIPGESQQTVFVRRTDPDSGREGAWSAATFTNPDPTVDHKKVQDFSNTWASGTIGQVWGVDTMKVDGSGRLVVAEPPSMFSSVWPNSVFDSGAGDDETAFLSVDVLFPEGKFTGPQVDQGAIADFHPNIVPVTDDFDRVGKEKSIFATEADFPMFRVHQREQSLRPRAYRYDRDSSRDLNWLATTCDGAPMRVRQEWSPDGATWYPWRWGQRIRSQTYRFRLFLRASRSRSAPFLTNWYWWRWRRNRKWEYWVDYDPSTPGDPHTFAFPAEVLTVIDDLGDGATVNVTVHDTSPDPDITHSVRTEVSAGGVKILVTEHQKGTGSATAGSFTVTFPRAFGDVPSFVATPGDALTNSYLGYSSLAADQVSGYYLQNDGTTGAGALSWLASGPPVPATSGGTVRLQIQIMGA